MIPAAVIDAVLTIPSVRTSATSRIRSLLRDRLAPNGHTYAPSSLPDAARNARYTAACNYLFSFFADLGFLRISCDSDPDFSFDDYAGDTYNVDLHASTVPGGVRTIRAQEKRARADFENDGAWYVCADFISCSPPKWTHGDACGGLVGYPDPLESDMADDIRASTLEQFLEHHHTRPPINPLGFLPVPIRTLLLAHQEPHS